MSRNLQSLSSRRGMNNGLFEQYAKIAAQHGAIPAEEIARLSEESLIGEAHLLGAASFYDALPGGRSARRACVCTGSACLTAGRQKAVRDALRENLRDDEIGEACCLGRCYEGGTFSIDGRNYSGSACQHIAKILKGSPPGDSAQFHVGSNLDSPLLTAELPAVDAYYAALVHSLSRGPEPLYSEIEASKLRGRGGAGFPLAQKLRSCRQAQATPKYIVCNADEGDPAAYSDRFLLEQRPHAVLAGMMAAGFIAGAEFGILYIRFEYPESVDAARKTVEDLRARGILERPLGNTGFSFQIQVVKGAGAYICGEETALLASLEGLRPEVRIRPPYPAVSGLFGKPTLVSNVESMACVPPILSLGGEAFSRIGTSSSTGSKLVSLDSHFRKPGVYEVAMGTPLLSVIEDLGGGFRTPVKAIQVGGPLGGIVPKSHWERLSVDFESFAQHGFLLGHAGIVSIPESFRIIDYLAHLFHFAARESCGKCFPCRLGTQRGAELLDAASRKGTPIDSALLNDLLETLELGSLCALGGGLPLPIRNALDHFPDELAPCFTQAR